MLSNRFSVYLDRKNPTMKHYQSWMGLSKARVKPAITEAVWDLDREQNKRRPTFKEELWEVCQEAWMTPPEDCIKKWQESQPKRVLAVWTITVVRPNIDFLKLYKRSVLYIIRTCMFAHASINHCTYCLIFLVKYDEMRGDEGGFLHCPVNLTLWFIIFQFL